MGSEQGSVLEEATKFDGLPKWENWAELMLGICRKSSKKSCDRKIIQHRDYRRVFCFASFPSASRLDERQHTRARRDLMGEPGVA
jgi:hypothetical protein